MAPGQVCVQGMALARAGSTTLFDPVVAISIGAARIYVPAANIEALRVALANAQADALQWVEFAQGSPLATAQPAGRA